MNIYCKLTTNCSNLNPGVGDPWAGQVKETEFVDNSSKDNEFVFKENFGLVLPMGSI